MNVSLTQAAHGMSLQGDVSMEARADALSDTLHRWATEDCEGLLWLAIDGPCANADPLPLELESALAGPATGKVRLRHPTIDPGSYPHWVPLNVEQSAGSALLRQSVVRALTELEPPALQRGKGRRIAGWLALDGDAFDAMEHWAMQMIRRRPDCGARRCLVRLHDPAVLWAAWHVLDPEQQGDLLGAVRTWCLLDPAGHPHCLQSPADKVSPSQWLRSWSARQWEDIDNITPLNGALRQWMCELRMASKALHVDGESRAAVGSTISREQLSCAIQAAFPAMRRGRATGFAGLSDRVALALLAMKVHPRFDEHPLYRQALAARDRGNGDETLCEWVQGMTEGDLRTIRRDLDQGGLLPSDRAATQPMRPAGPTPADL